MAPCGSGPTGAEDGRTGLADLARPFSSVAEDEHDPDRAAAQRPPQGCSMVRPSGRRGLRQAQRWNWPTRSAPSRTT